VSRQEATDASTLNGFRAFMHWRREHPALRAGAIRFLDTSEPVLAFTRETPGETLPVAFNLSDTATDSSIPPLRGAQPLHGHGLHEGTLDGDRLHLPAYGAMFAALTQVRQSEPAKHAGRAEATPRVRLLPEPKGRPAVPPPRQRTCGLAGCRPIHGARPATAREFG
jgi:hypothetical protein